MVLRQVAALLALSIVVLGGCEGRPPSEATSERPSTSRSEPHLAEIDLGRGAPERADDSLLALSSDRSFTHLVQRLRDLRDEQELRGLFVRLGTSRFGFARSSEIGRLLATFRERDLPVVCHADGYSNSSALLAAVGCDEVWLSPSGTVDTVGIAAQLLFGRRLLDKLAIEADFLQVGRFKGAIEPFTRDSASPEARQSLQQTLEQLRSVWLEGLSRGRNRDAAALDPEDGPYIPEDARERGLIDRIGFDHAARDAALARTGVDGHVVYFGGSESPEPSLVELVRILSGTSSRATPHVVVIRATGAITMAGGSIVGGSDGIVARSLIRLLRRLADDDAAKAVVLRIDSPGGSALASDLLWNELIRLRERKPVVASVGEMAASGGCYLASAATEVLAEHASIVGSIGVMGGKMAVRNTLSDLGITVESVRANPDGGDRALLESPFTPWDEATRAKVQVAMEHTYDLFLERVAEGRGTSVAAIRPAAEGRLFTGDRARELGLVDRIGGLSDAIDRALELAELEPSAPIHLADPPAGLLDLLGLEDPAARGRAAARIEQTAIRAALRAATIGLEPYRAEVETFVSSMTPLMRGERSAAALPYVFAVR